MLMVFLPLVGYFTDKIGLEKVMSFGSILLIIVALPCFLYVNYDVSITKILLVQMILSFCNALYVAPAGAFLASKIFPASHRYSGMALGISCGEAIFGGTSPLIATALVALTGASFVPGIYLIFCGFIGWAAVNFYRPLSPLNTKDLKPDNISFTERATQAH